MTIALTILSMSSATGNGPAAVYCFDPTHNSADILRDGQIAATQFFQSVHPVPSVVNRAKLVATQQLRQLSRIDPVTLATVFQEGVRTGLTTVAICDKSLLRDV